MEHRFYQKTKKEQTRIQVLVGLITLTILLLIIILSWWTKMYLLIFIALPVIISLVAPFFDAPSLKESGRVVYLSSLLLAEIPKKGIMKIHGGTLFDYFFVIDRKMNGKQRTNFILSKFLQGLLKLIEEKRNTNEDELIIRGTSYIINERTAKLIGLKVIETDNLQKFILIFNYVNLLVSQSFAKGKLSFPRLSNIKTFEMKISELIEKEAVIEKLSERISLNTNR
ncbi:hypothetical protein [Pedobacter helvus]|uniref:Uncharacterized protein n=1 Tax=Pedobacter helvus TaxID=2563444 RepID=A0ABW9JDJ3_9SPHI|nr:hypothetical protein [Pedobacter ureilyticus]